MSKRFETPSTTRSPAPRSSAPPPSPAPAKKNDLVSKPELHGNAAVNSEINQSTAAPVLNYTPASLEWSPFESPLARKTTPETPAKDASKNPEINALDPNMSFKRKEVTIHGEKVAVTSKDQALHAEKIIEKLKNEYGIEVNSSKGVEALKAQYTKVPKAELDKLKTTAWEYKELAALDRALTHFAPILGAKRKNSTESGTDQPFTTVSKIDQAIDRNSASGKLDTTTLGEAFRKSKNFSMFTAGTNSTIDFKDNKKQLEGTAVHELAHGLLKPKIDDFVASMDQWTDQDTASGKASIEGPPTSYGGKNAREDLSETAMMFFVDPASLKASNPKRYAWMQKAVKSWTKKKASTP